MKSIILKIVIVAALLGVIIVGVIIYFNNKDVEKRTYNLIINKGEEVDFEEITNHANSIKNSDGSYNEYAQFTMQSINDINEFIEYYVVFLPLLQDISNNDKKELVNLYNEYIDLVKQSESDFVTYQDTQKAGSESAINALSAYYTMSLNNAYKKGSAFLSKLISTVNTNAYENYEQMNFYTLTVDLLQIFTDKLAVSVDSIMNKQYGDQSLSGSSSITSVADYNSYINIRAYLKDNLNDSGELSNVDVSAFVKNYNTIRSPKDFFNSRDEYMRKLNKESQEYLSCVAVISFLNNYASAGL